MIYFIRKCAVMIYFIATRLDGQDGGSRSAVDILCNLLELEREVTVISGSRCALPPAPEGEAPYKVHWLTPPNRVGGLRGSVRSARSWARWGRSAIRHMLRRTKVAAATTLRPPTLTIHNGFPVPGSYANSVMERSPTCAMIIHSSPEAVPFFQRGNQLLTIEWVAAHLERSHALVFVSPQILESWSRIADIDRASRWLLPNTCREDEAEALLKVGREGLRASLGIPERSLTAVCVGNVNPGKGQDVLVDALPEMIAAVPDLLVIFVGNDTSAWAVELARTVRERGLSEHVRFTGARMDPYAFIRSADLMIHPSRAEGQGMVILEAMLLRTPVLASNVGGIPSSVTDGDSGLLIPPDDPAALAHAFRTLAADGELRHRLAARAEKVYWSRFSRREYQRRFHAIFTEIVAESQPPVGPVARRLPVALGTVLRPVRRLRSELRR